MNELNALPQFFQIVMVGLAGKVTTTQASTIKCMVFLMRKNREKLSGDSFQDFILKVTNINLLFLRDPRAPKELLRAIFKFVKTSISLL